MSDPEYFSLPGTHVDEEDFRNRKAKELAALLREKVLPFVRFVETRQSDSHDIVVLDVEPEVPQHPEHEIRTIERIAVLFDPSDQDTPEPRALRKDFPVTPHQNVVAEGTPRSLCLYEEPYQERRLRWTAARFVRRLQEWLAQTAGGEIHGEDQPLERLFFGTPHRIVLPSAFYSLDQPDTPDYLSIAQAGKANGRWMLIARAETPDWEESPQFVGVTYDAIPQTHGAIQFQPGSIAELARFLSQEDENFLGALRERLKQLGTGENRPLDSQLIILLRVPKRRTDKSSPESVDIWAFATRKTISEIGEEIGVWEMEDGDPGVLVSIDDTRQGENTTLTLLNPTEALTRSQAAELNATEVNQDEHLAIGLWTLGSQVFANLARTGYGTWTLVDKDVLLPHNVPRHYLSSSYVGGTKAVSMAVVANSLFEEPIAVPLVEDILSAEGNENLEEAYERADSVLDTSASVSVARHLALDVDCDARRASLFLSPDGRDLVLLAEPPDRSLRTDQLEIEYYRSLIEHEPLADHLLMDGERLRYGQSCRDVSSQLPQDLAAMHAAIGSRAYRSLGANPAVRLWRANDGMGAAPFEVEVQHHEEFPVENWTLSISRAALAEMQRRRSERLPVETGGVLIGTFDTQRSRIYVAGSIPAPPDSEEWPTAYKRGMDGLTDRLEEIDTRTAGQLEYVGEWHSHPPEADTQASEDDETLFEWLAEHRRKDGLPAVMAIQGSNGRSRWYVESLMHNEELSAPDI